ncbi:MAG: acylphosphatase [Sulfurimicrobium sp.]|jgi:acylphosphatase|nr:acylphosphatase [Sulfurimicrobium sp.]MDO9188345.1 acylphosphatase [Sulfurimicrobium sp.]MDP1703424.1 acylphosphatase [Sulfurimicrobium sp.]MDP2197207.1 acylphosphatase [Sulfurimicrobium sp.]MDP2961629.1 acylphosphatase [Sulfurimicrobium sp.]
MPDSPDVTKYLRLHGRVQGVYFRESMCRKAAELGITGWVRNRRDGTVEATVQGTPEAVEKMLAWARLGPPSAQVTRMESSEGSGAYGEFMRRESV